MYVYIDTVLSLEYNVMTLSMSSDSHNVNVIQNSITTSINKLNCNIETVALTVYGGPVDKLSS